MRTRPAAAELSAAEKRTNVGRERPRLSVIVPVGPGERAWPLLLTDLARQLPAESEVLLAAVGEEPADLRAVAPAFGASPRWLVTRPGRASQMNDAARIALGEFLWFLHADTRLPPAAFAALSARLAGSPDGLHYFGLRFADGPRLLRLNELGVALRCGLFGLPFGDQGFCLRRETFDRLGGFDESAPYGEDHLLVWSAKRHRVPLRRVPASAITSGRKYAEHGWARTTGRHVQLTIRQAAAEASRMIVGRRP